MNILATDLLMNFQILYPKVLKECFTFHWIAKLNFPRVHELFSRDRNSWNRGNQVFSGDRRERVASRESTADSCSTCDNVSYGECICMHRRKTFLASVRVESSSNLDTNGTCVSRLLLKGGDLRSLRITVRRSRTCRERLFNDREFTIP